MNKFKPLFGILLAVGFLILGIYQSQSEKTLLKTIGYISIFFWSSVLLFAIYKKFTTNKTTNKTTYKK
jgi:hypothetical protein